MKLTIPYLRLVGESIQHGQWRTWQDQGPNKRQLTREGWAELEKHARVLNDRADYRGVHIVLIATAATVPDSFDHARDLATGEWVLFDGDQVAAAADEQLRYQLEEALADARQLRCQLADLTVVESDLRQEHGQLRRENDALRRILDERNERLEDLRQVRNDDMRIIDKQRQLLEATKARLQQAIDTIDS